MTYKNLGLLYKILAQQEFVINFGTMGVQFKKLQGYIQISIVALGRDYGEQLFLTEEHLVKKERVIVEKIAKPKTVEHQDNNEVKEEDLFGEEQ